MKGKPAICSIVLLSALLVVGIVYACQDRPPAPICPTGQIETSPAVWVEGTSTCPSVQFSASRIVVDAAAYTEHRHYTDATFTCPSNQLAYDSGSDTVDRCKSPSKYGSGSSRHYHYLHGTDVAGFWGSWTTGHCTGGGTCEEREIPAVTHVETFGPIIVQYDKSNDPNHCHRPTGSSLGVPSWAMSEYNDLPELDAIVTTGYWIPPVCRVPVAGCMGELALNYNELAEIDDGSCIYSPTPTPTPVVTEPPVTEEPTLTPVVTEEPPVVTPESTPTPESEVCLYTVTTWFQCNTGAAIWVQETGITSGDGSNFIGYAPYNRECGFCDGLTGIYHREWRNTCDGSGWDEGSWNLPEWMHELNGCPLGGRCIGD